MGIHEMGVCHLVGVHTVHVGVDNMVHYCKIQEERDQDSPCYNHHAEKQFTH